MCAYNKYLIFNDPELPPKQRTLLNTVLLDTNSSMKEYTRYVGIAANRRAKGILRTTQEYRVRLNNDPKNSWASLYLTIN